MPNRWDTEEDTARKSKGPPCSTCIPDRVAINENALDIYRFCSGQLIIAPMGGAIDMNILAVKAAMELYGIKEQKDCLERVLFIFRQIRELEECN